MPHKDPEAVKAYFREKHRADREAADQRVPPQQCEHVADDTGVQCRHFTTVQPKKGKRKEGEERWVRPKLCRQHAPLAVVSYVDPKTGETLRLTRADIAQRQRKPYDVKVRTPAKTHATRRAKGWTVTKGYKRVDVDQLRERLRSPEFRLIERLGEIWKEAGLTPNLARITRRRLPGNEHPEGRSKGRPRKEWLPKDPYELLRLALAVERAREQGAGFVAIGGTLGQPFNWRFPKDGHGNTATCQMASDLYKFALALNRTMPGWVSLPTRRPRQAITEKRVD